METNSVEMTSSKPAASSYIDMNKVINSLPNSDIQLKPDTNFQLPLRNQ